MRSLSFFLALMRLLITGLGLFFSTPSIDAAYIQTYEGLENGGIIFTGNTLGLAKIKGQNNPGTFGCIGAFISQDNSLQVNNYPYGTTLDYTKNGSSAYLDLPPGSIVLYAELVWAGSYGFGSAITQSLVDSTQIQFITPDGTTHNLAPKPNYPAVGGTGQSIVWTSDQTGAGGYYVKSQDVTALVRAIA